MDRTAEDSKTKGGGVCFMINKKWCGPRNISILSSWTSIHYLEHLSIIHYPNTLMLPLSSQGTLTKPTSGRSCRTFTNMYPVQLEDRIHWIIATLSLKMPTMHYWLLANQTMPPFSSHRNINKGSFRNPRWRVTWSDALVLPLRSYATGSSWWPRLEHVPGEFIWCQRVHGCSIRLCPHANRASYWNSNYKEILQSETVGGQNNPCCG